MGEITYGLERLALYLQGVEDFQSLIWSRHDDEVVTYADVFHQYEVEMSAFNSMKQTSLACRISSIFSKRNRPGP